MCICIKSVLKLYQNCIKCVSCNPDVMGLQCRWPSFSRPNAIQRTTNVMQMPVFWRPSLTVLNLHQIYIKHVFAVFIVLAVWLRCTAEVYQKCIKCVSCNPDVVGLQSRWPLFSGGVVIQMTGYVMQNINFLTAIFKCINSESSQNLYSCCINARRQCTTHVSQNCIKCVSCEPELSVCNPEGRI